MIPTGSKYNVGGAQGTRYPALSTACFLPRFRFVCITSEQPNPSPRSVSRILPAISRSGKRAGRKPEHSSWNR